MEKLTYVEGASYNEQMQGGWTFAAPIGSFSSNTYVQTWSYSAYIE